MPSEALRVTTAVTIGALLLLGFAYYRYSVSRRKKRDDEDENDSEPSIEVIHKVGSNHSPPLDSKNSSNVSISITKTENGSLGESDKKEEARRIIQKVLSDDMIKKGVPESSKKVLEDTLESLTESNSLRGTPTRSLSSEKSPESSRYVSFEEVLKRKSVERSPTPTKSSLSPETESPSRSYVYLSREPSFTRDTQSPSKEPSFTRDTKSPSFTRDAKSPSFTRDTKSPSFTRDTKSPSEEKTTPPSPSFELFKTKRTSVEKEVTQVYTSSNVPLEESPRQTSPQEFKLPEGSLSKNDSGVNSNSSLNEFSKEVEDVKASLLNAFAPGGSEEEESSNIEGVISALKAHSDFSSVNQIEEKSADPKPEDVKASLLNAFAPGGSEEEESSNIEGVISALKAHSEFSSVNQIEEKSADPKPVSLEDEGPSSFEIVDLKPGMFEDKNGQVDEDKKVDEEQQLPPPLEEALPPSAEDPAETSFEKFSKSTNFRPSWAAPKESSSHVWEKGLSEKGKTIPKTEEDDEMNLLSRSQEKGSPLSKAPLLSDSDEEEAKPLEEAAAHLPKPMEDIREESEEPEEELNATQQPSNTTQGQDSKKRRNNKKKSKKNNS